MSDTRERILAAARELLHEHPEVHPSVRAVAARAGIGASTLRYHFPSQRVLLDELMRDAFERTYPDQDIRDASRPAAERLSACVRVLLDPVGHGEQARMAMQQLASAVLAPGLGPEASEGMERITVTARARVVSWLAVLAAEGALPGEDLERRARLLLVVVDGLSLNRALPGGRLDEEQEEQVIADAVAAALHG